MDKILLSKLISKSDFFNPGTAISTIKASASSLIFTLGSEIPVLKFEENNDGNSPKEKSSNQVDNDGELKPVLRFAKLLFFGNVAKLLIFLKF